MRVLISGASGLIGSAMKSCLRKEGVVVMQLSHSQLDSEDRRVVHWEPDAGPMDSGKLEGLHVVIHLAGDNIAAGRWTAAKKARIRNSRVQGTTTLCRALADCREKPDTLICASAVGYYGHQGERMLEESAPVGEGFLAEVCRDWEQATIPARDAGIRVVNLRIGMVLSGRGGALPRMLPPFRWGLGGPLGNGRAWMSWIALEDLVSILLYCMNDERLSGPVNAVAPQPVTNKEFAHALGNALGRPAVLPVPAFLIKAALGEMGRELLLSSIRAYPRKLEDAGFSWRYPSLQEALQQCL